MCQSSKQAPSAESKPASPATSHKKNAGQHPPGQAASSVILTPDEARGNQVLEIEPADRPEKGEITTKTEATTNGIPTSRC
jgi:hypothetical protein